MCNFSDHHKCNSNKKKPGKRRSSVQQPPCPVSHPHRHQYCQAQGQGLSPVAGPSIGSGGRYLPPPATKYKHDNINSDFKYFFPASFMASCNDVKQQKEGQITLVLMNLVPASPNLDATSGARQAWGLKIIST